jgi:hypothetical protein
MISLRPLHQQLASTIYSRNTPTYMFPCVESRRLLYCMRAAERNVVFAVLLHTVIIVYPSQAVLTTRRAPPQSSHPVMS